MRLEFAKMHGLGNDFMVVDASSRAHGLTPQTIQALSDRKTGVGFDQLLVVEPPSHAGVAFDYRIYNADGGEVEQCGNGARCFAVFVRQRGLIADDRIPVHTSGGDIVLICQDDGQVTVDMGVPNFEPVKLPFSRAQAQARYSVDIGGEAVPFGAVSIGNPHAVLSVADVERAPVESLGPQIETHTDFPKRVNVGFMQIDSRQQISLRVWERGVGETRACGTGACAAMVIAHAWGEIDDTATVHLPGGALQIQWAGQGHSVCLTGPAKTVFEGYLDL